MTDKEVCALLRICWRQLYTWRINGLIPYVKIGKAVRFRHADVENLITSMTLCHHPETE